MHDFAGELLANEKLAGKELGQDEATDALAPAPSPRRGR